MNSKLQEIKTEVYDKIGYEISDFNMEIEGREYSACRFQLSGRYIISRNAKVTPKKVGQFVTFWKRNENGSIEPYHETDGFDFYIVNVWTQSVSGQFVFPKSVLMERGIISTNKKEGKRGFRVYPAWDKTTSKQAITTQKWQLNYFFTIGTSNDFKRINELYLKNY